MLIKLLDNAPKHAKTRRAMFNKNILQFWVIPGVVVVREIICFIFHCFIVYRRGGFPGGLVD